VSADSAAIDRLIPHRPPFRFVDTLVRAEAAEGELLLELATDDPRLTAGRLQPLLLVEALAQSAAAYHGAALARDGGGVERGFLVQIDKALLRRAARGGESVRLAIRRTFTMGPMVRFEARARVGDETLAEAEITVAREAA
jgi:3-hydroxyacyl-[acyl-carrier-protein] dehydratase